MHGDAVANVTATDFPTLATLPSSNSEYATAAYWDGRFKTETEYEWFKGYEAFRALAERHVSPSDRILVIGCGTSKLAEGARRWSAQRVGCTLRHPASAACTA